MVKTATGQNGDTEMAIFKTATNPNTYSSSEAYIIDRRLYTYNGMQLLSYIKKVQYSIAVSYTHLTLPTIYSV